MLSSLFTAPVVVVADPAAPARPVLAATGVNLSMVPVGGIMLLLGMTALIMTRRRAVNRA